MLITDVYAKAKVKQALQFYSIIYDKPDDPPIRSH